MASTPSERAPRDAAALLASADFDPAVAVDGLVPGGVVVPESAGEMAEVLALCRQHSFSAAPIGGGTKLALGNIPDKLDVAVSTRALGGILAYEPTDLVCSVGAGALFGDVQAVLAEHGQTLPIDAPGGDEATIGGLVASALSGPRRLGNGSLRDLLIGISVAHPSGTVTHAGGMVVKNVSGYDLPRVYHGSLGTLGVIVSANFKVLPLPQRESTVLGAFDTLHEALQAASRIRQTSLHPLALDVMRSGQGWGIAVRLAGRASAIDGMVRDIGNLTGVQTWSVDGAESSAWWRDYTARTDLRQPPGTALLRLTTRPRDAATLAEGVISALAQMEISTPVVAVSPGLGQILVQLELQAGNAREHFLAAREVLMALADHCVVLAAPPEWKRGIDVWGQTPQTLAVMQPLKDQFDPGRVLNAGRFAGFI
jgi:glycolate oxidase FAD binding subunit